MDDYLAIVGYMACNRYLLFYYLGYDYLSLRDKNESFNGYFVFNG